ncbi:hypothetical protein GH714_017420 [Hevea brasiliensis]|uniref:LanC-like protein GCL1 n=1 Tax=Hevea brasiliensis TaxID=3981 RepID=A0A6A6K576_HEVBR|nr:hypothetical protein GH714_017420 [Hevea brasiliensis]
MSPAVEFASQESHEDGDNNNERLDFILHMDLTAANFSLPNESFLKAAISLKDQVVEMTWTGGRGSSVGTDTVVDPTVYSGLLGTAFTCLRSYEVTGSTRRALPIGPEEGGFGMSYDLMYGRAGFLWSALFLNQRLGEGTLPSDLLMPVVDAVLAGGRAGSSDNPACPLMYRWHGTRYMMSKRFLRSGNYPSSEGNPRDKLMQWSHGATGMAITLCKASQKQGKLWKSGLVKKVGLADGVAGNAYAFLSLYRLTGDSIYEERAKAFASFLYSNASKLVPGGHVRGADHAYSLFQGLAGTACLWFDLLAPEMSRFPGYEV